MLSTSKDDKKEAASIPEDDECIVNPDDFTSKKITNKVVQQIQDPLALAAGALPIWCEELARSCPFLLPFETRRLYFSCTAFGASRSIVWLQTQRDAVLERQRAPGLSPRRDDSHEFRVGRLKHERVSVPRGDKLLDWAEQVLKVSLFFIFLRGRRNIKTTAESTACIVGSKANLGGKQSEN